MKKIGGCAALGLVWVAAMGSSGLLADEGRIPLLSLAAAPPFFITEPGHYFLTENITFGAAPIIQIQANDVTVDLNDFTLTGGAAFPVIVVDSAFSTRNVTIRNGAILMGAEGIGDVGANRVRVFIEGVRMGNQVGRGIGIDQAEYVEISSCRIGDTGGDGIFVSGFNALFGGRFLDNLVERAGGFGIRLSGLRGGEVRRNLTTGYGSIAGFQAGIRLDDLGAAPGLGAGGNVIDGNTAAGPSGASEDGIILVSSDGNLVENNTAKLNTACGIRLDNSSRNKAYENVATNNTVNGMDALGASAEGNLFLQNVTGNNGGVGIDCTAALGNQIRGNMLFGDGVGAGCVDAGGNIL